MFLEPFTFLLKVPFYLFLFISNLLGWLAIVNSIYIEYIFEIVFS